MTKTKENKWSADSEMALMGICIPVESEENIKFVLKYIFKVLNDKDSNPDDVYSQAMEFNSDNDKVTHIVLQGTCFGLLIALIRDGEMKSLTDEQGVLAYVYNKDCPDCSELGYIFLKKDRAGLIQRIAQSGTLPLRNEW